MHAFLPAVGFSAITKTELDELFLRVSQSPDFQEMAIDTKGNQFAELRFMVTDTLGLVLRGTYDEDDNFIMDYYFPVFYNKEIASIADLDVIKESDKDSYHVMAEELKLGVSLIFQLQNMGDYIKFTSDEDRFTSKEYTLAGLSTDGKILLPIKNKIGGKAKIKAEKRKNLLEAAKDGDEEALEDLTFDDMELYAMIGRRVQKEDVFSIVVSTFMPYGIENDHYMVMGEIIDVKEVTNMYTMEEVVIMTLLCNEIKIGVCINKKDLLGEPAIGRRFKGSVWLQGSVKFAPFI